MAVTDNIVVTFSEAIQRGTGSIVLKTAGDAVIAIYDAASSANLAISGSTLTINPSADLGYSTGYKVEFAAGSIKDLAGNSYAGTTAYNFTTAAAPDLTAPTALTFSPADEATAVAIGSDVVVTFSEAIQRGTGNIILKTAAGAVVATYDAASSANLAISGSQLTINPSADLGYSTGYKIEFAAGSIKDLAGNSYAGTTSYDFTTLAQVIPGQPVNGGVGADSLSGTAGDDTVDGGAGIDSYSLTGTRSQYTLARTTTGYQAQDNTPGRDGTDTLTGLETLVFADCTVDLTMGQRAAAVSQAALKTLQELYVGFFNRVPEAAGLGYWIDQIKSGATLLAVADQFYSAGVQFGVYSENMTEAQFITTIYANVLGRTGASAPNSQEIAYWQTWLHTGSNSKGGMVLQMLSDSHTFFTGDPTVGWVVDLLDNKAEVANYFAVQQALSYSDPQTNIARGIEIAAAITPTDTSVALALIGVNDFSVG